jgi:hypothetical protein
MGLFPLIRHNILGGEINMRKPTDDGWHGVPEAALLIGALLTWVVASGFAVFRYPKRADTFWDVFTDTEY